MERREIEEIKRAAERVQSECDKRTECGECPFHGETWDCVFTGLPEEWNLDELKTN